MTTYKPHYACFNCRKTFKRKLASDVDGKGSEAKCPQCAELMANMGLDFESPKKENSKEWNHLKNLYAVGITFHSCGCSGPGYIPKDNEELKDYFESILIRYKKQLSFWQNRIEPESEAEIQRENAKHWQTISVIPNRPRKGTVRNEDAKKYWIERIKTLEEKIRIVKSTEKNSSAKN